jgi:YfiH family protein
LRPASWLRPSFSASNVEAVMTTRDGGISRAPFDSMNLRAEVGDDLAAVAENRRRLRHWLGVPSQRVDQVHGVAVARLSSLAVQDTDAPVAVADASVTTLPALACEIQVADCLPVLFADRQGTVVGAAHAGWRGLAGGVLEATVAALCEAGALKAPALEAWLGPCIGPTAFEVGEEVRVAFVSVQAAAERHFRPGARAGKWLADLPGLARDRLAAAGLEHLMGNDGGEAWCTVSDASRFFSFRRDRDTGRMAACIWRRA